MRKVFLGAAAAAALVSPGLAQAQTTGSINLGLEFTDYDSGSGVDGYNLGATVMHDMGGMTVQLDGRTTLQRWDSSGDYSHSYAAAHVSTDMGGWDLGGFVGLANYYGDGGTLVGAEARGAYGNFSFDGSITFTDFLDSNYSGIGYRLNGSYFFTPNFAVSAGWAQTDIDSWTDFDVDEFSVGGAYQMANGTALSLTYTNAEYGPFSNESDSILLGARFNFGGGTLQDNTNDGAWMAAEQNANTWSRW